jgi:tape measure domain-containing protein
MSQTLELAVKIALEAKDFKERVNFAQSAVDGLTSGIKGLATGAEETKQPIFGLQSAILAAGAAFAAFKSAKRLALTTIDEVKEISALEIRLSGLVPTAGRFAETQEYLSETANRLGMDVNLLTDSYSKLLVMQNSGILTTEQSREMLEGFSNVAAATGATADQLKTAMYGLSQGLSAGVLRAEELNQIAEPLPGILTALDAASGQAAGGFRKMVLAGEVTSDMLRDILIKALDSYKGSAEAAASSIGPAFNKLDNAYTEFYRSLKTPVTMALLPAIEAAISLINEFTANVNSNKGGVEKYAKEVGESFKSIVETIIPMVSAFSQAAISFVKFIGENQKLIAILGTLYLSIKGIFFLYMNFIQIKMTLAIAQMVGVSNAWTFLTTTIGWATTAVKVFIENAMRIRMIAYSVYAVGAAFSFLLGYQVGEWIRGWIVGLNDTKTGIESLDTVVRGFADFLSTQYEVDLRDIAEQTGINIKSQEEYNKATRNGAVTWNDAAQKWEKGAVSLEIANKAISRADALNIQQQKSLDELADSQAQIIELTHQSTQASVRKAEIMGDEQKKLDFTAQAQLSLADAKRQILPIQEQDLALSQQTLDSLQKQIDSGGKLSQAAQVRYEELQREVAQKGALINKTLTSISIMELEAENSKSVADAYRMKGHGVDSLLEKYTALELRLKAQTEITTALTENEEQHSQLMAENADYAANYNEQVRQQSVIETELMQIKTAMAEVSKTAIENLDAAISGYQREQAAILQGQSVKTQQVENEIEAAKQRENNIEAVRLSIEALKTESETIKQVISAKQLEIVELQKKAVAMEAQGRATDEYTIAEQNAVDAVLDTITARQAEIAGLTATIEQKELQAKATSIEAERYKEALVAINDYLIGLQSELDLQTAANDVKTADLERRKAAALARGDENEATRLSGELLKVEGSNLQNQLSAKKEEAILLWEKADARAAEAAANGVYTETEQQAVAVMLDAAAKAELEAEKLQILVEAKQDQVQANVDITESQKAVTEATEETTQAQQEGGSGAAAMLQGMQAQVQGLATLSAAASAAMAETYASFGRNVSASSGAALKETKEGVQTIQQAANAAMQHIDDLKKLATTIYDDTLAKAPWRIQEAWAAQKLALMGLEEQLQKTDGTAALLFGNMIGGSTKVLPTIDEIRSRFHYLDEADLSNVISQIEQLRQQADNAKASLDSLADSMKDELDRMAGNEAAIEQRRYEAQVEKIKELAKLSDENANAELLLAQRIHNEKMAQIKAEADAKKAAKQEEAQEAPPPPAPGEPPAPPIPRQQPAASPTPAPSGGGGGDTIYLTIQRMDVFPSDVAGFIKQLEEQAKRQ